jgi:hypothetical protein
MINIGLIKHNKLSLDNLTCKHRTKTNIKNIIKPLIEIKEVQPDGKLIGSEIVKALEADPKNVIESYLCLEEDGIVYYCFYCLTFELINENILASYLSKNNESVYGNIVILKIDYINNVNISISENEIFRLFKKRIVHNSVIIKPDNSIIKHKYIINPLINSTLTNKICPYDKITFLNGELQLYFEAIPSNDNLNSYATIIEKKLKIHGDVIITFNRYYEGEIYYIDINEDLFKKIMLIMSNSNKSICGIEEDDRYFYNVLNKKLINLAEINMNIPDDILNKPTLNSTIHIKKN